MKRREFLLTTAAVLLASESRADVLTPGTDISLRCLGDKPGPQFLDGRTTQGTVGLAPDTNIRKFSGTKWRVVRAGNGVIGLKCMGVLEGRRFLDGRTADQTVGLAPNMNPAYSGTRWQIVVVQPEANGGVRLQLKCLGTIEGPSRWLDGRTLNGTVGLAPSTSAPYTGTTWEARRFPVLID